MKICIIGTVVSSTLNFRKSLIELLIKDGHEVFIFGSDYNSKTYNQITTLGASPIEYKLSRSGLNPIADLRTLIQLRRKIKNISPDIVFSYFVKPVIYGTLAAKLANTPRIVGMLEGLGYAFTPQPPNVPEIIKKKFARKTQILLYHIAFKYLDRLIFLNKDDPTDLLEKNNITVKDYKILGAIGIDLSKFKPSPPPLEPIRFLFIGRLLAEKGIFEFLQAAKNVKKLYPNVEFIVLGSIDSENPSSLSKEDLNSYIRENIIIHPGHVENVDHWIQMSSVFVLPSYREGIPCSTQEAMSSGRAVITTNVAGCRETVENKINGFIINPFDSLELTKSFIELIKNKHLIKNFGVRSREIAEEKFNSKIQNSKLINFILK